EAGPAVLTADGDGTARTVHLDTGEARAFSTGRRPRALAVVAVGGRPAVVSAGDAVELWSPEAGVRIGALPAQREAWKAAALSDGGVEEWDAASGDRLGRRPAGALRAEAIAGVSAADGRRLVAVGDAEAVHLWDVGADRSSGPPLVGPTAWPAPACTGPGTLATASEEGGATGASPADPYARPGRAGPRRTVRC